MTPLNSHNGFLGPLLPQIHFFIFLPQSSRQTYHSYGPSSAFQLPLLVMCVRAHTRAGEHVHMHVHACLHVDQRSTLGVLLVLLSTLFHFSLKFIFTHEHMFVCVSVCLCLMCVQTSTDAKDPSAFQHCLMSVLATKHGFSRRAVSALNHSAIFPTPLLYLLWLDISSGLDTSDLARLAVQRVPGTH